MPTTAKALLSNSQIAVNKKETPPAVVTFVALLMHLSA